MFFYHKNPTNRPLNQYPKKVFYQTWLQTGQKKKSSVELLLLNKAVVSKLNSLQREFFIDCVDQLFNLTNPKKSNKKSKKYYLKPERKINFVFS
jgi:hypothetical protein